MFNRKKVQPMNADQAPITYEQCSISAKQYDGEFVVKMWTCGNKFIVLRGKQDVRTDHGTTYRLELGEPRYDGVPFGEIPKSGLQYIGCNWKNAHGNYAGYMTDEDEYQCLGAEVTLRGHWGDEYQGHWEYRTSLGELDGRPQWVDDPKRDVDFTSGFQKWCPTALGYKLCGWIDEPVVDHGEAPPLAKD